MTAQNLCAGNNKRPTSQPTRSAMVYVSNRNSVHVQKSEKNCFIAKPLPVADNRGRCISSSPNQGWHCYATSVDAMGALPLERQCRHGVDVMLDMIAILVRRDCSVMRSLVLMRGGGLMSGRRWRRSSLTTTEKGRFAGGKTRARGRRKPPSGAWCGRG